MIQTIITLLAHDLAVGVKNKTVCLVLFIPLFVYASLTFLDPTHMRDTSMKLALIRTENYRPCVTDGIQQAPDDFVALWASDEAEAMRWLKERQIDGVLKPDGDAPRLRLTVSRHASAETLLILQRLSALQDVVEKRDQGWITDVRALQASSVKQQTLPTWIFMVVLLVSFIVLPTLVAEEKEKQLLHGWLQTPVREGEWLASKVAYGMVLMLLAVTLLLWISGETACTHGMILLAMLCAGGFCFGALGICLGLLCRNQASARTLGVLSYLPLLLPAALSDMSRDMRGLALWIPSYQLYEPVRALLLDDGIHGSFTRSWACLVGIGLLACVAARRLMMKRWLM